MAIRHFCPSQSLHGSQITWTMCAQKRKQSRKWMGTATQWNHIAKMLQKNSMHKVEGTSDRIYSSYIWRLWWIYHNAGHGYPALFNHTLLLPAIAVDAEAAALIHRPFRIHSSLFAETAFIGHSIKEFDKKKWYCHTCGIRVPDSREPEKNQQQRISFVATKQLTKIRSMCFVCHRCLYGISNPYYKLICSFVFVRIWPWSDWGWTAAHKHIFAFDLFSYAQMPLLI